jgi:hypothetical protein
MPRYAALIYGGETDPTAPDWGQIMMEYGAFGEESDKAGVRRPPPSRRPWDVVPHLQIPDIWNAEGRLR